MLLFRLRVGLALANEADRTIAALTSTCGLGSEQTFIITSHGRTKVNTAKAIQKLGFIALHWLRLRCFNSSMTPPIIKIENAPVRWGRG